jgi:hypothetical protein
MNGRNSGTMTRMDTSAISKILSASVPVTCVGDQLHRRFLVRREGEIVHSCSYLEKKLQRGTPDGGRLPTVEGPPALLCDNKLRCVRHDACGHAWTLTDMVQIDAVCACKVRPG